MEYEIYARPQQTPRYKISSEEYKLRAGANGIITVTNTNTGAETTVFFNSIHAECEEIQVLLSTETDLQIFERFLSK